MEQTPLDTEVVPNQQPSVDYFDTSPAQLDLFGTEEDATEAPARQTASVVSRTAMMGAIVEADTTEAATDPQNYLATLMETRQLHKERINLLGDSEVRRQAAHRRRMQEVTNLVNLSRDSIDETERLGAAAAARDAAAQDMTHKAQYSLELETAEKIQQMSITDPYVAALYEDNLRNPTIIDQAIEDNAKRMMIQSAIEDIGAGERGRVEKVTEFFFNEILGAFANGSRRTGIVPVDGELKGKLFFPGKRIEQEAFALQDMTLPELAAALPDMKARALDRSRVFWRPNESSASESLRQLGLDTPTVLSANVLSAVEVVSYVPVTKIPSTARNLMRGGAQSQATELLSTVLRIGETEGLERAAAAVGMTTEEVVESALPSALVNKLDDGLEGVSTDATAAAARGQKIWEEAVSVNGRARLTDEEAKVLHAEAQRRVSKEVRGRPVKNVRVDWESTADGSVTPSDIAVIGKVKGNGGYASERSAQQVLETYGLNGRTYQDASGSWWAEAKIPVRETGFYTSPLEVKTTELITGRFLRAAGTVTDAKLQGSFIQGGRLVDKTLKVFNDIAKRNYGKLPDKDLKALNEILEHGRDTGDDWLTPDQLRTTFEDQTGRSITSRVQDSYDDVREIMDLEYYLRNQHQFKLKSLEGYENVRVGNGLGNGNGVVERNLGEIPKKRMFDISGGRHFVADEVAGPSMAPEQWARLKNDGYIHVRMQDAVELPDGTVVSHFIGKAKDFEVSGLARAQIPYKAGVHRMYVDRWFSKAARRMTQSDTGNVGLGQARAYRTFPSKSHADRWNATMNEARIVYNDTGGDLAALARVFQGRGEFPSPKKFVESIKDKKVDPSEPFETVLDGQLPTAYDPGHKLARFFDEPSANSLESLGRTQGRAYHSGRGDRLEGFDGKVAPTLSIGRTLNESAQNVSKLNGYGDSIIESTERMLATFQPHFSANTPHFASPQALIKHAVLKDSTPSAIKAQFETQRAIIGRVLGQPTKFDEAVATLNRRMEDVLSNSKALDTLTGGRAINVSRWASESNPFDAMRGFAFHMKLGLFNVAQMPLQISSSLAAATAFPKHFPDGASALGTAFVMRFAHGYGPKSAAILSNPKIVKMLGFKSADEAREMMTAFSQSGLLDVGNSHQLANSRQTLSIGKGRFGTAFEDTKNASATFFFEPEKFNRATAFTIAWRNARDAAGKPISRHDGAAMKKIFKDTEDFSFQMNSESAAAFQKGPASIPTQFFAYPIRIMELIHGKTLTHSQRARLFGSQLAFYGSAGYIVTSVASDIAQKQSGETPEKGTLSYALDRGMIDTAINMGIGGETDVAIGDRIGTGAFAIDLFEAMMNESPYGDKSVVSMLGGVSGQTAKGAYDSLLSVGKYGAAMNGDFGTPLGKHALVDLGKEVSTLNNFYRGYLALQHQRLYSRKGLLIEDEVTKPEAVFLMFGISNSTMNDAAVMSEYLKDRKERRSETAKLVSQFRREAMLNPGQEDKYFAMISQLQVLTDDVREWGKIIEESNRFFSTRTFAKSKAEAYQKERSEEEMSKNLTEELERRRNK